MSNNTDKQQEQMHSSIVKLKQTVDAEKKKQEETGIYTIYGTPPRGREWIMQERK